MKKLLAIASMLTVAASMTLTTSTPAVAAGSSYVLMCKAGRGMWVDYRSATNYLIVHFKAGRSGGSNGVAAGSCTWVDRGFRANEPKRICQTGVNDVRFIMNSSDKITRLTSPKAPYVKKILNGQTFQVRVKNDGHGCLKVTRAGV
ncbi:MAG: hypothetical protein DSZ29_03945 [Aquificaceae bacterium]|nr:MAG: hypothetical protein DSZ29_03945 [Aquificaceae bacterium]